MNLVKLEQGLASLRNRTQPQWVLVNREGDTIGFGPPRSRRTKNGTWVCADRSLTIIVRDDVFQWAGDVSLPGMKDEFRTAVELISRPTHRVYGK